MKVYKGIRIKSKDQSTLEISVTIDNVRPDKTGTYNVPLVHHVCHSLDGFEWGYFGSGPADLARSILWDFIGEEPPPELSVAFKERFVAGWKDKWRLTGRQIKNWIIKRFGIQYLLYLTEIADPRD